MKALLVDAEGKTSSLPEEQQVLAGLGWVVLSGVRLGDVWGMGVAWLQHSAWALAA